MDCVSDRIRLEGNLGLGVCAVPNGCDEDSGKALGKILLCTLSVIFLCPLRKYANNNHQPLKASPGRKVL